MIGGFRSLRKFLSAKALSTCLAVLCLPRLVIADSITLYPVADTSLDSAYPDNNLGANSNLVAGTNGRGQPARALLRFDPASQIPSNAIIQSVTLTLQLVRENLGGVGASIFDLHSVWVDWGEGTGVGNSGTAATNGEATWNARFYPTNLWSAPGAAISNDYSGVVSAALLVSNLGSYTFSSNSNLVSDVQQWLLHPTNNFGWILVCEAESTAFTARRFASREDPTNTPALQVQYLVPVPPRLLGIEVSGGIAQITLLAVAGQAYTLEYRNSLSSGTWLALTNLPSQSITTNQTITDPVLNRPHRCYRIGTSF